MIKITFLEEEGKVISIKARGHALFAPKGQDIVCSAVSAILVGGCNALKNQKNYEITIEDGNLSIETNGNLTKNDEIVMHTIIIQLMTIQASYGSFISISKKM